MAAAVAVFAGAAVSSMAHSLGGRRGPCSPRWRKSPVFSGPENPRIFPPGPSTSPAPGLTHRSGRGRPRFAAAVVKRFFSPEAGPVRTAVRPPGWVVVVVARAGSRTQPLVRQGGLTAIRFFTSAPPHATAGKKRGRRAPQPRAPLVAVVTPPCRTFGVSYSSRPCSGTPPVTNNTRLTRPALTRSQLPPVLPPRAVDGRSTTRCCLPGPPRRRRRRPPWHAALFLSSLRCQALSR